MTERTSHLNPWAALPVLLAGAFIVVLDFFIVNVALPSIESDLGAAQSSLEWVLAALVLAPRLVPESRAPERTRLDVTGAALLAVGLVAILLPLIEGRQHGWPAWAWISLGAAPAILAVFAVHQARLRRRGAGPLLDIGLLRERTFSAGLLTQLCLAGAQASFFVYLALYLQQGRGLDPLEAGLVFTILAVA